MYFIKFRNQNNLFQTEFDPIHIAAKLESEEVLKYLIGQNKLLTNLEDNSVSCLKK